MTIMILDGLTGRGACFYDAEAMTAFGPICADQQEAEDLLDWWAEYDARDPRSAGGDELHSALAAMRAAHEGHSETCSPLCADGHARIVRAPLRYTDHARCRCDCAACACPGSEEEVR